jgi:hypothetical protein
MFEDEHSEGRGECNADARTRAICSHLQGGSILHGRIFFVDCAQGGLFVREHFFICMCCLSFVVVPVRELNEQTLIARTGMY